MKKFLPVVLTAALAVSLWFNWRNRATVANLVPATADALEAAAPVLPVKLEEIDFSGTGLADEAWQLQSPGVAEQIPSALPTADRSETPPPPLPSEAWEPDVKLKLESRPP